jgi:hypothetical protein
MDRLTKHKYFKIHHEWTSYRPNDAMSSHNAKEFLVMALNCHVKQTKLNSFNGGTLIEGGRLCTVDLLVLTSIDYPPPLTSATEVSHQ